MSTATSKTTSPSKRERSESRNTAPAALAPAIVIGLDSMQGIQAARILARHKVPVIGVAANRRHAFCSTRVCKQIIQSPTASDELIDNLIQLGKSLEGRAVLFPSEDTNVLLVSRHREKLEPYFHIMLPDAETVEMLMDKVAFYTFAQQTGLPIPPTYFIENQQQLHEAIEQLRFPCVIKPRDSASVRWEGETIFKAFKLADKSELVEIYNRYQKLTDCFIVQEWIEGRDSNLYSCNCYFDSNSTPLVTFVARKIRQWPPETGISCLGEECRNDTVLNETLRLFKNVNYYGLGYMEMKQDSRNGAYYIVEPNIGRPTGRSAISEAGGVELLFTAYCDALGLPLPANREQTYQGVKWIHFRKDLQSSFKYWRRGELTLRQWWKSIRGRKAYALASWSDPWPFVRDWCSAVVAILTPSRRRKRKIT